MNQNNKVTMILKVFVDEEHIRTETFSQEIVKIGSLPFSDLRLNPHKNVSWMHAVIEVTSPDEVYILDLRSVAGTVVNGKQVQKSLLKSGDEIVLGDVKIVVEMTSAGKEE